jgi:hypothetical protein
MSIRTRRLTFALEGGTLVVIDGQERIELPVVAAR